MNYLAHVFLAEQSPEGLVGAILGDFVKGRLDGRYGPVVREGILLHRLIDRFTEDHTTVRASRALIQPERRRFAGIMIDVFYDHFLAKCWRDYSAIPLPHFTQQVYAALQAHYHQLPERLQRMLPAMRSNDWLAAYGQLETIHVAIDGISRRLKRKNRLQGGGVELERNYTQLEAHFMSFFEDLTDYIANWKNWRVPNSMSCRQTESTKA